MNWTAAQKEAITYENKQNILVAAAAGSGKTAVLVERIIRKILDPTEPVSVDEILVLTFTNAAAREMKNKIAAAIEKKLKEIPDNQHLRSQTTKIAAADVSHHKQRKCRMGSNIIDEILHKAAKRISALSICTCCMLHRNIDDTVGA